MNPCSSRWSVPTRWPVTHYIRHRLTDKQFDGGVSYRYGFCWLVTSAAMKWFARNTVAIAVHLRSVPRLASINRRGACRPGLATIGKVGPGRGRHRRRSQAEGNTSRRRFGARMIRAVGRWHLELAGPDPDPLRPSLRLGTDIGGTKAGQGNGKACFDQCLPQISSSAAADCNDPVVLVDVALLAINRRTSDQTSEERLGLVPAGPVRAILFARLVKFDRIDAMQGGGGASRTVNRPCSRAGETRVGPQSRPTVRDVDHGDEEPALPHGRIRGQTKKRRRSL